MLKKILLISAWLGSLAYVPAQDTLVTLDYCLERAEANHPLFNQYDLLASSSELKIKNLNRNYLPEMNVNGDVHYQSDVVEVPVKFEGFAPEPLDKDWYKISLEVSELIYDGGVTRKNKDIEYIDNQINRQTVGVDLYKIKERIVGVYFSIISLKESQNLLNVTRDNLAARLREAASAVKNGVVLASDADILKAELLKIDQQEIEIQAGILSGYKVLSILSGEEIAPGKTLDWEIPAVDSYLPGRSRPEYQLFSLQQQKAESMKKLSSSRLIPRLIAYGQAGYGRPGYDMLKNEFDDFYTIGAKLSWNVWNWNKSRNEKTILDLNKEMIGNNEQTFDQNLQTELERKLSEIRKIEELIPKDKEIAMIREGIVQSYSSRLQNGVITATEYVTELHAELQARLNLKIHEIQLARAKYEYLAIAGKL
ncbi:MAG: TolC family protein [Bacteroidales bacterium]|nr:TolC family protein [Bacteroidales bacterium]